MSVEQKPSVNSVEITNTLDVCVVIGIALRRGIHQWGAVQETIYLLICSIV